MLIIFLQSERALSIRKNQGFLFPLKILTGRKFFSCETMVLQMMAICNIFQPIKSIDRLEKLLRKRNKIPRKFKVIFVPPFPLVKNPISLIIRFH